MCLKFCRNIILSSKRVELVNYVGIIFDLIDNGVWTKTNWKGLEFES
jgi:hypothetical protein